MKRLDKNHINYKNRGMFLESVINNSNKYYFENNIAYVYKKETPIGIRKTKGNSVDGFFKEKSTLDFVGLYKGNYIEFDAKECSSTTSFPLNNIANHQIEHIKCIIENQGITFLIIYMNENYYLLNGVKLIEFIKNNTRKSIPFSYIKSNSFLLKWNYSKGLNYLDYINILLEEK